ncbi:hypothetical protein GCM10023168_22140 [Fodinibacter luteus]|uniref:DUF2721 domain-containing protein n=1 Tax=Fodinibacter luteus TaxID=552064 RepID=A0ABP8KGR4_9MICO
MADTTSISALLSASAVVGALTTSQVVTWYVEAAQLSTDVTVRSSARKADDEYTRQLKARQTELTSKKRALLWVAGIQWAVVTVLLLLALSMANPWQNAAFTQALVPFFMAACALVLALVVVPVTIAAVAVGDLRGVASTIGPASGPIKTRR